MVMKIRHIYFTFQVIFFIFAITIIVSLVFKQYLFSTVYNVHSTIPYKLPLQENYKKMFDSQIAQIIELSQQSKIIVIRNFNSVQLNYFLYQLITNKTYNVEVQFIDSEDKIPLYLYINYFSLKLSDLFFKLFAFQKPTLEAKNAYQIKIKLFDFRKYRINNFEKACSNLLQNSDNYNYLYSKQKTQTKNIENVKCIIIIDSSQLNLEYPQLKLQKQFKQIQSFQQKYKKTKNKSNNTSTSKI